MTNVAPAITVRAHASTLAVHFGDDDEPLTVTWRWVRDHSHDPASFDAATGQRQVDTFALPIDHPAGIATVDGDAVRVTWPDDTPDSILPIALLLDVARRSPTPDLTTWSIPDAMTAASITYDDVINSNAGRAAWLADISRFGVGLISNAPLDPAAVDALVDRIGYVRHTIFGGTWSLSSEIIAHADSAYGAETLEPHTDGSYSHDGPGMQLFLCLERTGEGGESVLVDGFAAAQQLRHDDPAAFDVLTQVAVPAHYIEHGVHLLAARPTIRLDDRGVLQQVTFNNYDRSPFVLPPTEMDEWYRAYGALHNLITDRSTWWMKYLTPGDVLIFDNWRCLHGRMAYNGTRVFHGGYLNHEDLESSLRVHAGDTSP